MQSIRAILLIEVSSLGNLAQYDYRKRNGGVKLTRLVEADLPDTVFLNAKGFVRLLHPLGGMRCSEVRHPHPGSSPGQALTCIRRRGERMVRVRNFQKTDWSVS